VPKVFSHDKLALREQERVMKIAQFKNIRLLSQGICAVRTFIYQRPE
jgi:hypothetical protein